MTTNVLLAAGTTALDSADIIIAAGGSLDIYAKPATTLLDLPQSPWELKVMKKTSTDYYKVVALNAQLPAIKLSGAGTYKISRPGLSVSVGCDSET